MTDIEILRSVGLHDLVDHDDDDGPLDRANKILCWLVLKAMAQARADERVQVGRDINIATINGDLPDICECVADFVVSGK